MAYRSIVLEKKGGVAVIKLNRPDVRNALNRELMSELVECLSVLESEKETRCVVITGGSSFFSAGADIKEMKELSTMEALKMDVSALWDKVGEFQKPLIAAVNGYAYGGGLELAMCCDIIVCGEKTKLGQPEINIGIIPGAGGTQRLTRAVGLHKASEMILTGKPIDASEAKALHLVNAVVPEEKVLDYALEIAAEISSKAPLAVKMAKAALKKSQQVGLESGLEFEHKLFYLLFSTRDQKEGMSAFLEKRKPVYQGQ
ncbi:MAG: enoyl-CoA hydratase-related protein [Thermoprotei archaeon]